MHAEASSYSWPDRVSVGLGAAVLRRHSFTAASPPVVTISGLRLGYLMGGAIFSEVVFAWRGLGLQLYPS